jgi:hypothetical protein
MRLKFGEQADGPFRTGGQREPLVGVGAADWGRWLMCCARSWSAEMLS